MGDSELDPFDIKDITGATGKTWMEVRGLDGHKGEASMLTLMVVLSLVGISFFVEKHTLIFGGEGHNVTKWFKKKSWYYMCNFSVSLRFQNFF